MEATATIPEVFKVGILEYKIDYESGLFHNLRRFSFGFNNTGQIQIADEIPLTLKKEHVFIQLFALCGDFVEGAAGDTTFQIIVARQLWAMIRANPKLIEVDQEIWSISEIKYLGKRYRVYKRPSYIDCLATLEKGLMLIDVSEHSTIAQQWLSLYHELLHLIRQYTGQNIPDEEDEAENEEERIVDSMAFMLMTLFSSNDMSWVLETEDEALDVYIASSLTNQNRSS